MKEEERIVEKGDELLHLFFLFLFFVFVFFALKKHRKKERE